MGTSPPRPSFTKDAKKRDFLVHPIRKSAAKARLIPAPTAAPFTPQTTGCGILVCQTNKRNKPHIFIAMQLDETHSAENYTPPH